MPGGPAVRSIARPITAARLLALVVAVSGCASPNHRAPVEERTVAGRPARVLDPAVGLAPSETVVAALPGAENAGKPGYYTVKPGDTMIRIGLETGQNWKDVVRWNNLENPNLIETGQVLRVVPPGADPTESAARPVTAARVETRALDGTPAPAMPTAATPPASSLPPAPPMAAVAPPPAAPAPAPAVTGGSDEPAWMWPAAGPVIAGFDDVKSKGLAIAGKAGDPVLAAADGRVVYAGSGLRGYGNLVILKHNNIYLTAYAHNQSLSVKEDQSVRRGQKIAEMGSSDAERVQLHFEIRRQGKPVDPARLLPAR